MSKTYDEKLEDYLRGLIETLMRKYSFSKKRKLRIIMSSYVWPSKKKVYTMTLEPLRIISMKSI